MPIGFPFSKASQIASLTEEERKELERARGAAREPIDFNLSGAYEYLRDKGLEEPQAIKAIAEKLSEKADFNYEGARRAQFTDEMIISRLVGRESDDLRPDLLKSFGEGVGRAVAREAPASAAFAGAATVTPGGPLPKLVAGTAAGIATGLFDAGDMVEDFLFTERQLLPSERSAARVGDTLGSMLAWILPGKQVVKSIPDEVNLGSRRMLQAHQERRNKILNKERSFEGLSRKEKRSLEKEPFKLKATQTSERLLEGLGRGARETGVGAYATADLLSTIVPAMAEGILEYMYPGREDIIISGGIASSLVPTPAKIIAGTAGGIKSGAGSAIESIKEEGFLKAAGEGFGIKQAIQTRRQEKAAAYLAQAFEDAGEDPLKFAEELEAIIKADPEAAEMLTAGQLSNNPLVLIAERTLANQNRYLDSAQRQAAQQGAQRTAQLIETLEETGDPRLLQYAAQLKNNALDAQFTALIDTKLAAAVSAADKLPNVRGGQARAEIAVDQSTLVKEAIIDAHDAARKIATQKYDAVNKLTMVDTKPLLNAYLLTKEKYLLKGEKLPSVLMDALEDMGLSDIKKLDEIDSQIRLYENDPKMDNPMGRTELDRLRFQKEELVNKEGMAEIQLGEVIKFKNRSGAFYRQAKAGKEPFDPAVFSELNRGADVVLLNRIVGEIPEEVALQRYVDEYGDIDIDIEELIAGLELTPDQKILKDAYQYSRAMNKAFRQTIAGDMTRMDRDLAQVITFDEALDKVFTGNSSKVARQARELQEAMSFVYGDMDKRVHSLNGHMDAFLRNKMTEFTEMETQVLPNGTTAQIPVIKKSGLDAFKRKYNGVLELPGMESLKNDLNELDTANVALQSALAEGTERYKNDMAQVGLANFLNRHRALPKDGEPPRLENVSIVLGDIASQDDPVVALTRLAKEIKEYAPEEIRPEMERGLFSALMEFAEQKAINKNGNGINFTKMYNVLFDTGREPSMTKFGKASPSIMDVLQREGIFQTEQVDNLKDILDRGRLLQGAFDSGIDDFINVQDTPALKDFFLRYAGARGISALSTQAGMVPSIQETGAGAQLIRNVFVNFPRTALQDILVDVSSPGRASALASYLRRGAERQASAKDLSGVYNYVANTLLGAKGLIAAAPSRLADDNLGAQTDRRFEQQGQVAPPMPVPPAPAPMAELSIPQGMQATPPPPAPGPQMASQRQQYAQMFPFDTASDVIRQQGGIGSLMT